RDGAAECAGEVLTQSAKRTLPITNVRRSGNGNGGLASAPQLRLRGSAKPRQKSAAANFCLRIVRHFRFRSAATLTDIRPLHGCAPVTAPPDSPRHSPQPTSLLSTPP